MVAMRLLEELDDLSGEEASALRTEANLEASRAQLTEAKARYNAGDAQSTRTHSC